jgi:hypothetical protein
MVITSFFLVNIIDAHLSLERPVIRIATAPITAPAPP